MWMELLLTCFSLLSNCGDADPSKPPASSAAPPVITPGEAPVVGPAKTSPGVEWTGLTRSSLRLIGVMHGFRWATEPGTRAGGFGLGSGYTASVAALHGWADGDPFYVNYVGHPMQGAVANHLWHLHDPRYKNVEFGVGRDYWKSKLRGAAFAWAFSEQFEIGPLSEASIGHIQRDYPQQGFVDHVITPSLGMAWSIGEDALDRYVVRPIEDRTSNRYLRLAARGFLNPARSFANLMDMRPPWYRTSRAGILTYAPAGDVAGEALRSRAPQEAGYPAAAPFEFTPVAGWRQLGGKPCVGGGAEAAWRAKAEWQIVLAVNGCKMTGLAENVSGDALVYQVGPRWTPAPAGKWSPFAHLLIGGIKVTQEQVDPARRSAVLAANQGLEAASGYTLHDQYALQDETNALALTAGVGVDYRINAALAFRVANLEYLRSHLPAVGGVPYSQGFQMSAGMVLRLGTW